MKSVIGMLNSKYIHSSLAPWCLAAGVEAYGITQNTAEVVEGTVNMELYAFADRIVAEQPNVIGLCCYIWNIVFVQKLLPLLKSALPDAVIILGGPEVSFNAGDVLEQQQDVDYVLSGEGEKPFAWLLNALDTGADVSGIPGICFRRNGLSVVSEPFCPLDEPPSPYTNKYFQALGGRIAYLETSRGCPFSCAFCLSGRLPSVRYFSMERIKRELILLANSGTQTVKFVDRTFNANNARARQIIAFIIENSGVRFSDSIRFHFEVAGDLLDEETLMLLETAPAGLFQLEIGLQSFDAEVLDAVNRRTDIGKLKRNIERLISSGRLHIHLDLIAGLPYEGISGFAESFNMAYKLRPNMLQLGFLKLLHGAPMRECPELYPCQFSGEPPYRVTETPWITPDELDRLQHGEKALDRIYNSGRFRRTLDYVFTQTGETPFALFLDFGALLDKKTSGPISLDDLTAFIFEYFCTLNGVDRLILRDTMVCDRLATNASGKLPPSLRITDRRLQRAVAGLTDAVRLGDSAGSRHGCAILVSQDVLVCADYGRKDPVTGEYPIERHRLT